MLSRAFTVLKIVVIAISMMAAVAHAAKSEKPPFDPNWPMQTLDLKWFEKVHPAHSDCRKTDSGCHCAIEQALDCKKTKAYKSAFKECVKKTEKKLRIAFLKKKMKGDKGKKQNKKADAKKAKEACTSELETFSCPGKCLQYSGVAKGGRPDEYWIDWGVFKDDVVTCTAGAGPAPDGKPSAPEWSTKRDGGTTCALPADLSKKQRRELKFRRLTAGAFADGKPIGAHVRRPFSADGTRLDGYFAEKFSTGEKILIGEWNNDGTPKVKPDPEPEPEEEVAAEEDDTPVELLITGGAALGAAASDDGESVSDAESESEGTDSESGQPVVAETATDEAPIPAAADEGEAEGDKVDGSSAGPAVEQNERPPAGDASGTAPEGDGSAATSEAEAAKTTGDGMETDPRRRMRENRRKILDPDKVAGEDEDEGGIGFLTIGGASIIVLGVLGVAAGAIAALGIEWALTPQIPFSPGRYVPASIKGFLPLAGWVGLGSLALGGLLFVVGSGVLVTGFFVE